jgi:hypothetical protein
MTGLSLDTLQAMPGRALTWGLGILFCGWAVFILHGLLLGRISTDGLLRD